MKKIKIILALLALMPFTSALAQEGEIIYRDFEPDSILIVWQKIGPMLIDLDGGEPDMIMWMEIHGKMCYPFISGNSQNIWFCAVEPGCVLSEIEEENWNTFLDWWIVYQNYHYAFRIGTPDGYCYGWFENYLREVSKTNEKRTVFWGFDRTAYCTIPNYPLMWGQTDLWGVEENEDKASCQLHPNPTTGLVRIEGAEASEVQVFNALGQLVKTVQNTNEVNLEGLPQGVYLLRVRDAEGTVFAKRVIVCR